MFVVYYGGGATAPISGNVCARARARTRFNAGCFIYRQWRGKLGKMKCY